MLRGLWSAYERQLASHPVTTQMATSFLLWGTGDMLAQRIEHYEQQTYDSTASTNSSTKETAAHLGSSSSRHSAAHQQQQHQVPQVVSVQPQEDPGNSSSNRFTLDRQRMALTAGFGAGFVGPLGHYWYEGIEKVCRRIYPAGGLKFLATKVVLDSAVMGSVYVAAFFAFGSLVLEGSGWQGFVHKMKVDFLPTYAAELAVWPVVQALNFSQVPVRHQLLVVNTFSLLDAAFISWAGNQEDWLGKIVARMGTGGAAGAAAADGKKEQ